MAARKSITARAKSGKRTAHEMPASTRGGAIHVAESACAAVAALIAAQNSSSRPMRSPMRQYQISSRAPFHSGQIEHVLLGADQAVRPSRMRRRSDRFQVVLNVAMVVREKLVPHHTQAPIVQIGQKRLRIANAAKREEFPKARSRIFLARIVAAHAAGSNRASCARRRWARRYRGEGPLRGRARDRCA